jgi:adenylate cyclase
MGKDEAGTAKAVRKRLEAARPVVADHGRIVKTMGDGLLAGVCLRRRRRRKRDRDPEVMDERNAQTPEDKRILASLGVNLGDVLIEEDDILGNRVNIGAA